MRVVLADDHPVVRDGLRSLLASLPGVELVGEATTGRQAVREAVLHRPDVVVMDLHMPDLDGIAATLEVVRAVPSAAVLVLTMFDDDDSVFAAMRAGARGYLLKGAGQAEITGAIRAVAAGQAIFGPGVAARVLGYFAAPRPEVPFPGLTAPDAAVSAYRRLGADRRVLELMAVPLAMALRAGQLAEQVAASRGRIVAGQEEERRRLRRDLHDGLGPTLTGMAYKIDATRNTLAVDPTMADELLAELRATTAGAIDDVRRVVYGLRPPSLDELGLAGALRQQAQRLSGSGRALEVTVEAPSPMPRLPAAVEVAAYRIAVEAITNVARRSAAVRACVRLAVVPDELRVTVTDDGARDGGPDARWQPGVGLNAMAERAAEVGGWCSAAPTTGGGRVEAVLPLRVPEPATAAPDPGS